MNCNSGMRFVFSVGVALGWLFHTELPRAEAGGGQPLPPCQDINGDGSSDVSDAIFLLQWRFLGGPTPVCPPSQAQRGGVPDTGQSTSACYGLVEGRGWDLVPCEEATCAGQDGFYATGCPSEGRFVEHGDGTLTDNCTGLVWQQDTADVNGDGELTDQDLLEWCNALVYCEHLSFAGHDDWRLPNVRELQSIVDYGRVAPSIDPVFGVRGAGYWSSTSHVSGALSVDFVDGFVGFYDDVFRRNTFLHVRAVRSGESSLPPCQDINGDGSRDVSDAAFFLQWLFLGGPEPACRGTNGRLAGLPDTGQSACYGFVEGQGYVPVPCGAATCPGQDAAYATGCPSEGRFVNHGDGTLTDNCTGLMWQQNTADVNGDGELTDQDSLEWCSALVYCENLSFAGHDDWRLPNVRELQSIVDYGRSSPATDPVFGVSPAAYWSSTKGRIPAFSCRAFCAEGAWFVDFANGVARTGVVWDDEIQHRRDVNYVQAVRSGP